MEFKSFKKVIAKPKKLVDMARAYTCEYCGDQHKSRCDVCDMPPCRCLC